MVAEPSIIIIGSVLLLSFIVPVIWIARNGSKRDDLIKKEYEKIKREHHMNASEKDHWQNRLIGIDTSTQKMVFIHHRDRDIESALIDLPEIKDVKVKKTDNGDIALSISMKDGRQKELSFYNARRDYTSGQYTAGILAEKWRDISAAGKEKKA